MEMQSAADRIGLPVDLERAAKVVLVTLAATVVVVVLAGSGAQAPIGRLGGDFPEFFGAGRLVLHGHGHSLYDMKAQADVQRAVLPKGSGYLDFSYPPLMAVLYAPIALLPYRYAFLASLVVLVAAIVAAVRLLADDVPWIARNRTLALAGAITFSPLLRSIAGGQNTALYVLVVVLTWRARCRRREVLEGVCVGLLLLKPQYAVVFVILLLLERRWRALAATAACGFAQWLLGWAVVGPGWVGQVLDHIEHVSAFDADRSSRQTLSLLTLAQGTHVAVLAVGGALVVAALFVMIVRRAQLVTRRDPSALLPFALLGTANVLLAPHAIFYDAGIAVLALAVLFGPTTSSVPRAVPALWLAAWLGLAAPLLPFNPLVLVMAVAVVLLLQDDADGRPPLRARAQARLLRR